MFKRKTPQTAPAQKIPTSPTNFPDGAVVVTETGRWYIKGKYRYLISSDRVFYSWSFPLVINATEKSAVNYSKMGKLGFRAGTLIFNDGKYYFVTGNTRRKISDPDVFVTLGINPQAALWVSDEELALHKLGEVF